MSSCVVSISGAWLLRACSLPRTRPTQEKAGPSGGGAEVLSDLCGPSWYKCREIPRARSQFQVTVRLRSRWAPSLFIRLANRELSPGAGWCTSRKGASGYSSAALATVSPGLGAAPCGSQNPSQALPLGRSPQGPELTSSLCSHCLGLEPS